MHHIAGCDPSKGSILICQADGLRKQHDQYASSVDSVVSITKYAPVDRFRCGASISRSRGLLARVALARAGRGFTQRGMSTYLILPHRIAAIRRLAWEQVLPFLMGSKLAPHVREAGACAPRSLMAMVSTSCRSAMGWSAILWSERSYLIRRLGAREALPGCAKLGLEPSKWWYGVLLSCYNDDARLW